MKNLIAVSLAALLIPFASAAGPKGDWTFTDIQGVTHKPFEDEKTKALAVVFIITDCPIANYFHPTLRRIADQYGPRGLKLLFVHPDPYTTPKMAQEHKKEFGIEAPVIMDPRQELAKRLGAEITPEAFLIDRTGKTRYQGRINDIYTKLGKKRQKPTRHDLRIAIESLMMGMKVMMPKTKAVGCYLPEIVEEKK